MLLTDEDWIEVDYTTAPILPEEPIQEEELPWFVPNTSASASQNASTPWLAIDKKNRQVWATIIAVRW
jgi:hypothetical protein